MSVLELQDRPFVAGGLVDARATGLDPLDGYRRGELAGLHCDPPVVGALAVQDLRRPSTQMSLRRARPISSTGRFAGGSVRVMR